MTSLEERLFLACSRGDVEGVRNFLKAGANMNMICSSGRTAFGTAAQLGNTAILKVFLENCVQSKSKSEHRTRTQDKSNCGYFVFVHNEHSSIAPVAESAKVCSADKNRTDDLYYNYEDVYVSNVNRPTFDIASFNDSFIRRDPRFTTDWLNEVDFLCDEEALTPDGMDNLEWDMEVEANLELPFEEDDPWSALYLWYAGILSQTSSLLENTPPPNDLNREDQHGRRAMHYAAVEGHVDVVQMLIDAGCKVNVGDSDNLTPLHLAAARDYPNVVELLIRAGANVNCKTTEKISPLHVSASRGLLKNVQLLLEAGSHIDTLDSSDRTPLFMAVSRCHENVVAYLLEQRAKVNIEEIHGYTPLYEAVWQKNANIARLLLRSGAKVTQSHLLLHYAVLHRHEEMVRLLIDAGSIINLRDESGDTPLILTAKTKQPQIARLLLVNGASVNSASYVTGNTVLHEAVNSLRGDQEVFEEMLSLLQEYHIDLDSESEVGFTSLELAVAQKKDEAAASLVRRGASVLHSRTSQHLDPFACILLRGNHYLAELFVLAGYPLDKVQVSPHSTSSLDRWLVEMKTNPMRLCDICRVLIRRQYKSRIYEQLSKLSLPPLIKKFLKLLDVINND